MRGIVKIGVVGIVFIFLPIVLGLIGIGIGLKLQYILFASILKDLITGEKNNGKVGAK